MISRRLGKEDSATRALLLDAAEQLMVEEGYAAVTSRQVASRAGLKNQLVHYYFRTMDDLFLAMLKRIAENDLRRLTAAMAAPNPVRALWEFSSDPKGAALILELWVLGNHRKAFRRHIADYMVRLRKRQVKHLSQFFKGRAPEPEKLALLVANLVVGVSRPLVGETVIGLGEGHDEIRALFEAYAVQFDPPPA